MKIASLQTGIVRLPNDEPLAGFSENPNAINPIVWLRLRSDDGIEGLGVTYFGGALTGTLRRAVDELGALAIGEDAMRVEAIHNKLRDAAISAGPAGVFTMALSAIDVALWDIKGKALGMPAARCGEVSNLKKRSPQPAGCVRKAIAKPRCSWACPVSPRRVAKSSRPGSFAKRSAATWI